MKILMTIFHIQDYGGIVPHVEHLAQGFRELGHSVEFVMLMHQASRPQQQSTPKEHGWSKLGTGYWFHPSKGWRGMKRFAYYDKTAREKFKDFCSGFDAVLWHIPVPTMNNATSGHAEWLDIYPDKPNFAIIHDGNLPKLYPHILHVRDKFRGLICVHDSAYVSSEGTGMDRALIVNPFDVDGALTVRGDSFDRRNGLVAVQVFKAWKRVDTLIRAVPHIDEIRPNLRVLVGGGGIEQRYMTSEEKTKPQYRYPEGDRIWDRALKHGMEYVGYIPNSEVYEHLRRARLQVDPSWSRKYSAFGAHFNRTTVEAMLCGVVPVATDLGMKGSTIFKPGVNYVQVPHTATPREFAEILCEAHDSKARWVRMTRENKEVAAAHFDRKVVAQAYIDFMKKKAKAHRPADPALLGAASVNLVHFGVAG